jgi:excisionase family DNA binding protein
MREVEEHLSPEQTAARLGVSTSTVWRWVRERRLRVVKLSHRITRIPASSVNTLLKECKV